jgi:uncharacterized membrane protein
MADKMQHYESPLWVRHRGVALFQIGMFVLIFAIGLFFLVARAVGSESEQGMLMLVCSLVMVGSGAIGAVCSLFALRTNEKRKENSARDVDDL